MYFTEGIHPGAFYWPVLYPFLGSVFGFLLGNTALGLQFVTVLSFSTTVFFLYKILHLFFEDKKYKFWYVLCFGMLSPYFLKSGMIVMSDAMASMFVILSFYFFFKFYLKQSKALPMFFFMICAFMTRYASLIVLFPILIYALYIVYKKRYYGSLLLSVFCSMLVTIPFLIFQWGALLNATSNYFLNSWSLFNFFKSSYITADGVQEYSCFNLLYVFYVFFHPGFIFIGVFLGYYFFKKRLYSFTFFQKTLLFSIALYLFFLAGIPFQNSRVLGLIYPLVLLFLYPAYKELMQLKLLEKHFAKFVIPVVVLIQLLFFMHTYKSIFYRSQFENIVVSKIISYQGTKLYAFDLDIALAGRGLNFEYESLYDKLHNNFLEGDLVLFNPTQLKKQWKGKNPMINWKSINTSYKLNVIETFGGGWHLYQLQNKKDNVVD